MSGVATAIAGAAVVGAIASDRAGSKAASATRDSTNAASQATQRAADQARGELMQLFPAAQENAQAGFQGALDVFGQSLPAQTQAFQQGNVNAQQQLLAGLPQIQNAILGGNVDLSALQPSSIDTSNLGFFQQQLPEFTSIGDALGGSQQFTGFQSPFNFGGFQANSRSNPNINLGGVNNLRGPNRRVR